MAKFTLVIDVDIDELKKARAEAGHGRRETICDAIEQELGWVNASGISVQSIEKFKEKK
jgi:hypothetical protein